MYHGLSCFERGLQVLSESGVAFAGGGHNLDEARRPAFIERNGVRVGLVARTSVCAVYAPATAKRAGICRFRVSTAYEPRERVLEVPGSPPIIHTIPNPEDKDMLAEDIRSARQQADVVVLSWHWGVSPATGGKGDLVSYQTEMAHFAIDVGADIIVGHHPHVLQPIEVYKGKVIAYSLGNYVHDMHSFESHGRQTTMLIRADVKGGAISRVSYVPGILEGTGPPRFSPPAEARDVVSHMQAISAPFGTRFETGDREVEVILR
jgi:poly-gamma-glutamate capsule biosynthesis protein CapA/YwtB (metallophosphatase superfamily)